MFIVLDFIFSVVQIDEIKKVLHVFHTTLTMDFDHAVVESIVLSILLAVDFAPTMRLPNTEDVVLMELARLFSDPHLLMSAPSFHRIQPHRLVAPASEAFKYVKDVVDPNHVKKAVDVLHKRGHMDFVFDILSTRGGYRLARTMDVEELVDAVASILDVHLSSSAIQGVETKYLALYDTNIKMLKV